MAGGGSLTVIYTLEPGWPALSKRLQLQLPAAEMIQSVDLLGQTGLNVSGAGCAWATDYGKPESLNRAAGFHRCADTGLMVTVTNPFPQLKSAATGSQVRNTHLV